MSSQRRAALQATIELIGAQGAASVTFDRVAKQAGIGRATVYRHWPSVDDLLVEAFAQMPVLFMTPGDGSLVDRLRASLTRFCDDINESSFALTASALIERAHHDDRSRALRDYLVAGATENLRHAVDEALAAGELTSRPDLDELFADLFGPVWARRMLQGREVDPALVERTIARALQPYVAPR